MFRHSLTASFWEVNSFKNSLLYSKTTTQQFQRLLKHFKSIPIKMLSITPTLVTRLYQQGQTPSNQLHQLPQKQRNTQHGLLSFLSFVFYFLVALDLLAINGETPRLQPHKRRISSTQVTNSNL